MTRNKHSKTRAAAWARRYRHIALRGIALACLLTGVYLAYLGWSVSREFEQRRWDVPAKVYATPLELYAGLPLTRDELLAELGRLGYRELDVPVRPGTFHGAARRIGLVTRAFEFGDGLQAPLALEVSFAGGRIDGITDAAGRPVPLARLDPLLIGSVYPVHGEDRLILAPSEIPPLLLEALKSVEDRRFEQHRGIDLRAVLRAAWVNLSHAEIRQGASTLTQQLVRSYFLSNERTLWRKIREAVMAVALELKYDKDELLHAYVNEIYLAQDGARAVHGFGLASQFYFGKPATELELHELALLVAQLRGPAFYDPRKYPERSLGRRNLVLRQMADLAVIDEDTAAAAKARALGVIDLTGRSAGYYAAFLDLVRRQLRRDYPEEALTQQGLKVFSTLDPRTQSAAERALVEGVARLESNTALADLPLEGAAIVTSPHNAEVLAVVGSRRSGFDGFNRALDARRQVGSLIKPAVYLAALESGEFTLASAIEDGPIELHMPNGDVWSPKNFNGEAQGPVSVVRALAESLNMATVQLGMQVGIDRVAGVLMRLGLEKEPPLYPSLLLGSLDLTPLEVTQMYNSLSNGGFRVPLRAVHSVFDNAGELLQRYPLEITPAGDPAAVHQLNAALVQVMERGTGQRARSSIPAELTVAGKTGSSDGLRDSWFAGFTQDHLVVVWVGADDNRSIGLTGASGASTIWARLIGELGASPYSAPRPASLDAVWIDYPTGFVTSARCADAVQLPIPHHADLERAFGCSRDAGRFGARVRKWFQGLGH